MILYGIAVNELILKHKQKSDEKRPRLGSPVSMHICDFDLTSCNNAPWSHKSVHGCIVQSDQAMQNSDYTGITPLIINSMEEIGTESEF